jgi:broad specificity phosphatase PhoE
MSQTIHLVRHGQVENPKGVLYGRLPGFHLSAVGRQQAEAAAERLADADIGVIWASPLERAQETAAAIAARHSVAIVTDDRLIESGNEFEGKTRDVLRIVANPANWWRLRNPTTPSWGESFKEIKARVLAAIEDAVASANGREVVIVSHQTPVLVARLGLARRRVPPWLALTPCQTGSITTVVLEGQTVLSASYFAPAASSV